MSAAAEVSWKALIGLPKLDRIVHRESLPCRGVLEMALEGSEQNEWHVDLLDG